VVYVLDRSISMGLHHAFDHARRDLLASLGRLPPTAFFQVIAYNQGADLIYLRNGAGWIAPEAGTLEQVEALLARLAPSGRTDSVRALRRALALAPDLVYLVSDGGDLTAVDVATVTRLNEQRAAIHAIELTGRRRGEPNQLLRQLAAGNRGTYRRVVLPE
jgi:hypothetical protein